MSDMWGDQDIHRDGFGKRIHCPLPFSLFPHYMTEFSCR